MSPVSKSAVSPPSAEAEAQTRRPTCPHLEEILFVPLPVLDHGFVRVVDYMGDDSAVIQAARVSYGRGTRRVSEDRALINYLMRHRHTTPFEMAEIKLHVKLPIFVARQWVRHRTANVNEYSARYSVLDKEFYVPTADRLAGQSIFNRQGSGELLGEAESNQVLEILRADAERNYQSYVWLLNEHEPRDPTRKGLAREIARINLTLATYTQWYWKIDLHNFLHFVLLRADPHAQSEIRAYADRLLEILKRWVPYTYEAFLEHQLGAVTLSRYATAILRRALGGEKVTQQTSGLSKREWSELAEVFKL